jgi:AcrR family transcriptional regulator
MQSPTAADAPRRRGRPRSDSAEEAIHAAALEVVAEVGYKVATLETIAARAGVGTATIYRRYPTKREMLVGALRAASGEFIAPHTGQVSDDLAILIQNVAEGVRSTPMGRLLAAISFAEPEIMELAWAALAQPRRAVLEEVVVAAIDNGQLRPDLDVSLFLDVLSAVPVWSQLVRPGGTFTAEAAHATTRLLLAGAASVDRQKEEDSK